MIGNGADTNLDGGGANDTLGGTTGDDVISGGGGADIINGGDGNDTLYGHSQGATGVINAVRITQGLSQPVAAAGAPGDPGFLYVVEKASGVIHRVDVATGARTTFLDIPNGEFTADGERGVLGIAFHPQYASNGRYFVFLTDTTGDLQVREYHRSTNPAVSETSFSVVWETPHPGASNHNGGWIGFSPVDGYLYIATGDGGGGGDPNNNAQNLNSSLGKILRIDVNGTDAYPSDPNLNYAIPANNPFVGVAGADEIWAYGLRNPWRNAFDPRDGSLYLADVGQSAREEVSLLTATQAGANLGWRIMEGDIPYNPGPPGTPQPGDSSLINPIYAYPRSVGTTITGGEVYTGPNADFVGQYVFADFGSNRLFTLQVVNGAAVNVADRTAQIVSATGALTSIVEFASDSSGALYAIGIGGQIWRLDMGPGAEDVGDTLNGGAGNDHLEGGVGGDQLIGEAGIDHLDGGHGADTMSGGADDDLYFIDNAGDVVTENTAEGTDTVYTLIDYRLGANLEALAALGAAAINLYGNALANTIVGNGAQNTLDGGAGADTLIGGGGNDLYLIDSLNDIIIESPGEGTLDTIYTSLSFFQMGANVENAQITGASGSYIVGNGVNNLLVGGSGADTLEGGAGIDTMVGGTGDDSYIVADQSDVIIENTSAGNDTIYTSISFYQMGANAENLVMTGAGGSYGVGNALNNLIVGNSGADTLDGGLGGDFMVGNQGDDIYFVNDLGDRTVESANEGTDAIYASISWTVGANVENLVLQGSGNINGGGNALNNFVFGNSGANIILGGAGSDVLSGGAGADTFVYNAASEGGDAIADFISGADHINVSAAGFGGGLAAGGAAPLVSGSNPSAVGASFLYDTDDGRLLWDSDGAGGASPVLVATLSGAPILIQSDILIGP